MASVLKVDKLDPQSGTALEIGTSGDTVSIPSGATLDISASTLTPPATMPASSGINFTALNATNLGSGTVPTARLGTGTASSSTVLYGDQTYKAEPGLTGWTTGGTSNSLIPSATDQGIYLGVSSATAENLLDDYEFGVWTPTLGGDTTYSIQSGKYTKIGRQVFVSCVISVTTLGTGSTNLLSGFPFTSVNAGGGNMGGGIFYFASLAVNVITPTLYKANGTTSTNFKSNTAAGTSVSGNLAIFGNSSRVDFSMTYEVT